MALLKGTLDVLVLKTLSWTPMHAYEIVQWIEARSDSRVLVDDPAMIQALHRLEERKLVVAEWGVTKNGRRARYYRLTPAGKVNLREESERLTDYVDAFVTILAAKKA
ncbi:MAG: helix-turn-helix transcriptional regulator [bacterium]